MRVRATRLGFHNERRRPGDVFDLVEIIGKRVDPVSKKLVPHSFTPEEQFSEEWMEKVSDGEDYSKPDPVPSDKKPFGAKQSKAVGYSAPVSPGAHSPSTGDRKVI